MISFDFEYIRPSTWIEAVSEFKSQRSQHKTVMYYAGGTEFISRARMNEINVDVIIDIKAIPECTVLHHSEANVVIGSAVTLTDVINHNYFPLLSEVARNIATKTARNKITVGGNLMSNLPYKEALLPFLLADSTVIVATENGLEEREIAHVFTETIQLHEGEFIVQIMTDTNLVMQPFFNEKITKQSNVNYPILTGASIYENEKTRVAFSGLVNFPLRLTELEDELNDTDSPKDTRIKKIIELIPSPILNDMQGSKGYRIFVLENMLTNIIEQMEGIS